MIAIENVRLFEEVQARTAELQESLEYQTAISDVLEVIGRSPSELQPVFHTIAAAPHILCRPVLPCLSLRRQSPSLRSASWTEPRGTRCPPEGLSSRPGP